MSWNFSGDKPIFQQLVDIITKEIITGKYKPGDKLEAVRDLAVAAGVNPNTMQRALTEIEASGIIYTKRGDGRYVSEDEDKMQSVLNSYVDKSVKEFIESLKSLGLNEEQILNSVSNGLKNQ